MRAKVAIVGAGITGLAAAAWLSHDSGIDEVRVLDADTRPGGKVRSEVTDGHVLEWGPQGFLDSAPDTLELVDAVDLRTELVSADERGADRFIVRNGQLRRVPTSPLAFLSSDVLELGGRLRVLAEPFGPRRPDGDESVFDFARRRIGRRAAEVLVDAMVTGVFAGDSRDLSLAATFPRMAAMEAEHGSLTRAMLARMVAARRKRSRAGGPAGPAGTLTTFRGGMNRLPERLAERLGDRLMLQARVTRLERTPAGFHLGGEGIDLIADRVLLSLPARATATLVSEHAPVAVPALEAMTTAPIAVHMASFSDRAAFGRPVTGFGFLVPSVERLGILGTLFCHAIFPDQSPEGRLFLRTMVGGARDPEGAQLGDEALDEVVREALDRVLGGRPEPERRWIVRWPEGIAQYRLGHLGRVAVVETAVRDAGLDVAGSPYRGVSVNDCIRQAREAARRIAARLS